MGIRITVLTTDSHLKLQIKYTRQLHLFHSLWCN